MGYYYLSKTVLFMLTYGVCLLVLLAVWRWTKKQEEPSLPFKAFGYLLLSVFRFSINGFHLPLGAAIALVMAGRARANKKLKMRIAALGAVLFLASFFPLERELDDLFYPKGSIDTYLQPDIDYAYTGFNMTFNDSNQRKIFYFLSEKHEYGREVYEALLQSVSAKERSFGVHESGWFIELYQDHEQERFRRLLFHVSDDMSLISLKYGTDTHFFRTSDRLKQLLTEIISGEAPDRT